MIPSYHDIDQIPGSFPSSPVFDRTIGFGGFDSDETGCLTTGPFAGLRLSFGPGKTIQDHCLTRGFNSTFVQLLTPAKVNETMELSPFETFRVGLEEGFTGTPKLSMHSGGHFAIGGEMKNAYSSPGGE